jgi:hypothetical protein
LADDALGVAAPFVVRGAVAREPEIVPFRYAASDAALADLKQRLRHTRLPDGETTSDWSQGVSRAKLRALLDHGQFIRVTQGRSAAKCAPTRKTKKPLYIAGRTTLLQPAFAASMNGAGWEDEGISEAWLGDIKTFGGGRRTACLSDEAAGGRPRRRIRDWPICSLQLG